MIRSLHIKYYIAIEPKDANNEDYGAMLLDFDGCTAQSETLDKLLIDIAEAGEEWAKVANENNIDIPQPSDIETLKTKYPNLDDFVLGVVDLGVVDLDLSKLIDKVERINILKKKSIRYKKTFENLALVIEKITLRTYNLSQ